MFGVVSKSSKQREETRGLSGNFRAAPGSPDRLRNPWNGSERLRAVPRRFRTAACVSERLRALRNGCGKFGAAPEFLERLPGSRKRSGDPGSTLGSLERLRSL